MFASTFGNWIVGTEAGGTGGFFGSGGPYDIKERILRRYPTQGLSSQVLV